MEATINQVIAEQKVRLECGETQTVLENVSSIERIKIIWVIDYRL